MHHTIIQKQLSNGISLVLVPMPSTEGVTAIVFMGVGSRFESDTQRGLAHFTEHMVFKGGKTYPTAQSIAQTLDAVGGEFNAFTSHEYTGYYTKTAARHLEVGLSVLADMTLHATFPSEELEKEKGVIVEEINMYEDMPMRKVDHVLSELVFGQTELGLPILGSKESVTAFTAEDFRHYREQFYHGDACTIVLAGAVDPNTAPALIEQYFAELPAGSQVKPKPFSWQSEQRLQISYRESEQSHLLLALPAYQNNHPKRFAYRVLATILGGNMSSRLFTAVREQQGLCYYVRATPDSYTDTGLLVAAAGVDNTRLTQAVAAILEQYRLVREEGISDEELDRAKQFLLGRTALGMEDSEQVAEAYGLQQVLEKKIEPIDELMIAIEAVTLVEVAEVANELLHAHKAWLAIVGPQKETPELRQLLGI